MKVGVILTGLIIVMSGLALLSLALDTTPTSTAGLAYFVVALYAVGAVILVWFGVFLATVTRKAVHDWRLANRG